MLVTMKIPQNTVRGTDHGRLFFSRSVRRVPRVVKSQNSGSSGASPKFSPATPLEEVENSSKSDIFGNPDVPKRVCIFCEPTPFHYISGYKNRFQTLIRYLRELGCEVLVVTTGKVRGRGEEERKRGCVEATEQKRVSCLLILGSYDTTL